MKLDFKKCNNLIPAIIQDDSTQKVLMLGFINQAAYEKTLREGKVTFWSRSKQRLWTKGETSGNYLFVKEILSDCDNDALLIKAHPQGAVCHTGSDTCFDEINREEISFLSVLERIIHQRRQEKSADSYVANLFEKGTSRIAQKVGEEATETIIEALSGRKKDFIAESADLLFHFLVLLADQDVFLQDVAAELKQRHKIKTAGEET